MSVTITQPDRIKQLYGNFTPCKIHINNCLALLIRWMISSFFFAIIIRSTFYFSKILNINIDKLTWVMLILDQVV